jgi:hypothetical protein
MAHRSQTADLAKAVGHHAYRDWWGVETFRSARSSSMSGRTCRQVADVVGAS